MIKYQDSDIPVFPIPPNFDGSSFYLGEKFGSLIFEALSTKEQRMGTAPRSVFAAKFQTLTLSEQETGFVRKMIESAGAKPVALPLWCFKSKLTADTVVGNSSVACESTTNRMFDKIPRSIVWNDFNDYETFDTFDVNQFGIQFAQAMTRPFRAGAWVAPVIVGLFKRQEAGAVTDIHGVFEVDFEEKFLIESWAESFSLSLPGQYGLVGFEDSIVGGEIL